MRSVVCISSISDVYTTCHRFFTHRTVGSLLLLLIVLRDKLSFYRYFPANLRTSPQLSRENTGRQRIRSGDSCECFRVLFKLLMRLIPPYSMSAKLVLRKDKTKNISCHDIFVAFAMDARHDMSRAWCKCGEGFAGI